MPFLFRDERRARPFRLTLASAACLLLLLAAAGCDPDGASRRTARVRPRSASQPRTNLPMPPVEGAQPAGLQGHGWTLLDGRRSTFEDFRGQVLVLDFYATYCPPCREEIPHLNALQRRFKADGVNIVGLNVGGPEDRAKVPGFVRELSISYPLGNPDDALVDAFFSDNTAIPQTYVFDRRGRLVQRFIGYDSTAAAQLEKAIQEAVNSKS